MAKATAWTCDCHYVMDYWESWQSSVSICLTISRPRPPRSFSTPNQCMVDVTKLSFAAHWFSIFENR